MLMYMHVYMYAMYAMYSKNSTHLDHNETTHYTTLLLPPPKPTLD